MILVEKHAFKFNKEMDDLSFQCKNLYNSCLYIVRQSFIENGKYVGYMGLYNLITKQNIWNDCLLPKKVCGQIVRLVDQNFSSFFKANKEFNKNPNKFKGKPKIPKYKDSVTGRCLVIYEKGAISKKFFKSGIIALSQTNIKINTKIKNWNDLKQVRIVPKTNSYVIEVVYEKETKSLKKNDNPSAIDLGLNNLATVSFSNGRDPFILNGKPLKSINQYYNKTKAKLQSKLNNNQKSSKRIIKLTDKRNNKITDYLHKSSRYIVNQLVSKDISQLIIGYNKLWKQDISIGKRNNQNFVNIPFYKFISMLEYKCKLEGIKTVTQEESYTSKCSFLDNEPIQKQESYLGRRIKRGLFKSSKGELINADLNGSYNIMRKVVSNFKKEIEGFAVSPRLVTV